MTIFRLFIKKTLRAAYLESENLFTMKCSSSPLVMEPDVLAKWLPHVTMVYAVLALHTIRKLPVFIYLGKLHIDKSDKNPENL